MNNFTGIGRSFAISGFDQNAAPVQTLTTVEEFAQFLKISGARIEQKQDSLTLIIGGYGSCKVGSMLWTRPDPTIQISVFIQSNDWGCGVDFNLPKSIVVRTSRSAVEIPAALLTQEHILHAYNESEK